jgi:hypothetical protein
LPEETRQYCIIRLFWLSRTGLACRPASGGARLSGNGPDSFASAFFLLVIEYFPDHHRVLDAGNDLDGAATRLTGLDVDLEDVL